jgi:hypothetical protein
LERSPSKTDQFFVSCSFGVLKRKASLCKIKIGDKVMSTIMLIMRNKWKILMKVKKFIHYKRGLICDKKINRIQSTISSLFE